MSFFRFGKLLEKGVDFCGGWQLLIKGAPLEVIKKY
jgi:hypothetical protein